MAETRRVAAKLQVITNILVIAAVVLLITSITWSFVRHYTSLRLPRSSIQRGTKLTLPDVEWSLSRQNLVLVLSTHCQYCNASAPFYRRLVEQVAFTNQTRLIAIFPQTTSQSRQYLARQEIEINTVREAAPVSLGVKGIPTLILVDANGVVTQSWDGMLSSDAEHQVLDAVR